MSDTSGKNMLSNMEARPSDFLVRGKELTDEYEVVGETGDGIPVAKKGDLYFLTDGEKLLTNGFENIRNDKEVDGWTYIMNLAGMNIRIDLADMEIEWESLMELRDEHKIVELSGG